MVLVLLIMFLILGSIMLFFLSGKQYETYRRVRRAEIQAISERESVLTDIFETVRSIKTEQDGFRRQLRDTQERLASGELRQSVSVGSSGDSVVSSAPISSSASSGFSTQPKKVVTGHHAIHSSRFKSEPSEAPTNKTKSKSEHISDIQKSSMSPQSSILRNALRKQPAGKANLLNATGKPATVTSGSVWAPENRRKSVPPATLPTGVGVKPAGRPIDLTVGDDETRPFKTNGDYRESVLVNLDMERVAHAQTKIKLRKIEKEMERRESSIRPTPVKTRIPPVMGRLSN